VCVLTAGFPCQELSLAGPRTGLSPGTRSGLWHHVVTAVDALNPFLVVIEIGGSPRSGQSHGEESIVQAKAGFANRGSSAQESDLRR
jgi:C-5 cytosine-specific DNA methylase